ncbi:MAG: CRTAC1 family protein [Rhizobiaceae bacterium]|nr:CRTAC1 family protein [Rhizobiaceae bacterium]MCV0409043.1 CRTAC1 family protein [Rhizobiaceae bacterium]
MRFAATVLSCLLLASSAAAQEPALPRFVDETGPSGLDATFAGEWEFMVGGGVAVFDCNDDGFQDMLVAGGQERASFFRNGSRPGGRLSFERAEGGLELNMVSGAWPLDIDSDGHVDVALLRVGENVLMRGLGGCRFERANEAWGFDGGDDWSTAFAATWEKGAGWPTIAIGNYVDRAKEAFPWGNCSDNRLHRPESGERRFAPPSALKPSYCTLSMLFTDWNRSGTPSLRVSNDREYYKGGQEQLWRVEPGRKPVLYTAEEGWKPLKIWGMGIAGHDVTGDGYPDYFLTSMADNKLQTLTQGGDEPAPDYKDIAFASGVTAHRPYTGSEVKPSTAWHAEFQDVNNDGRADLFVAKGNVWEMPDFAQHDPNNLLLQKADGTFVEAGDRAGVASMRTGRGGALADLNLDGLVDLVVVNRNQPAELWRNASQGAGGWISLRLSGDGDNRDATGAWIEVRTGDHVQRREVTVGGGHAGGQIGWIHFGLGTAAEAELRVLWPHGEAGPWQRVSANAFYDLKRDHEPEPWTPAP